MEEILKNVSGWSELGINSSELQIVGGANKLWYNIVDKIRNIIDFIGDYVPKLIQGIIAGFNSEKLF